MPPNTVYVGRPTKLGNPFLHGFGRSRQEAVEMYRTWLSDLSSSFPGYSKKEIRKTLRGKNLACWCPLAEPCHADVLLEMANE